MQNKDFFSGVPIEVREFLLRLLNNKSYFFVLNFFIVEYEKATDWVDASLWLS